MTPLRRGIIVAGIAERQAVALSWEEAKMFLDALDVLAHARAVRFDETVTPTGPRFRLYGLSRMRGAIAEFDARWRKGEKA